MAASIADKLRIKPQFTLLTLHAPVDYKKGLQGLPAGVKITDSGKEYNQVHWFVMSKAQLEKEMSKVMKLVNPEVTVWVYYPKVSSKIQTDLTRDKGWDCLLAESDKLTWISLISFNDTWSVFGFRAKTEADKKKEAKPKVREIFNWVNPETKEIKLPVDLAAALKKNKKEAAYFGTLSFTNKKEYIEWIVTAKREETRIERIKGTIERLGKQWKNPRNL
ncbi:MAG TPA: YdeI/OmpD-associated family protein [Chitinophagaceae bacterium]|nr:YdeI/OmpD-associated family protein [Chitinophagaceae bacterium]HNU14427.1 YdeI/OmpD-associated family protein [Chitinophagaceae bacterium]